jgi:hypothetical protein
LGKTQNPPVSSYKVTVNPSSSLEAFTVINGTGSYPGLNDIETLYGSLVAPMFAVTVDMRGDKNATSHYIDAIKSDFTRGYVPSHWERASDLVEVIAHFKASGNDDLAEAYQKLSDKLRVTGPPPPSIDDPAAAAAAAAAAREAAAREAAAREAAAREAAAREDAAARAAAAASGAPPPPRPFPRQLAEQAARIQATEFAPLLVQAATAGASGWVWWPQGVTDPYSGTTVSDADGLWTATAGTFGVTGGKSFVLTSPPVQQVRPPRKYYTFDEATYKPRSPLPTEKQIVTNAFAAAAAAGTAQPPPLGILDENIVPRTTWSWWPPGITPLPYAATTYTTPESGLWTSEDWGVYYDGKKFRPLPALRPGYAPPAPVVSYPSTDVAFDEEAFETDIPPTGTPPTGYTDWPPAAKAAYDALSAQNAQLVLQVRGMRREFEVLSRKQRRRVPETEPSPSGVLPSTPTVLRGAKWVSMKVRRERAAMAQKADEIKALEEEPNGTVRNADHIGRLRREIDALMDVIRTRQRQAGMRP